MSEKSNQLQVAPNLKDKLLSLKNSDDIKLKYAIKAKLLGYREVPPTIEQFITDPYYLGTQCEKLFPYWKEKLKMIFPDPFYTRYPFIVAKGGIGCFSGNQQVRLADNRILTLKELYDLYPEGGFEVYSWDIENNLPKPGYVSKVWDNGEKEVYEVEFSINRSKEKFKTTVTGNHQFLLTNGKYVRVDELQKGDSIRSLYFKENINSDHKVISIKKIGTEHVYDMTVEGYHNYGICDQLGNLLYVHNCGKSTFSKICACYLMCRLLHLKDIHNSCGLMPGKRLYFSFLSRDENIAITEFDYAIKGLPNGKKERSGGWLNESPFFSEHLSEWNEELGITCEGPKSNHAISKDVMFYNLSELNFMPSHDIAKLKLDSAINRLDSRFQYVRDYYAMLIVDTSVQGTDSIADQWVADNPFGDQVLVISPSQWEAREGLGLYSGEKFKVYLGDSVVPAFIVTDLKPFVPGKMDSDRILEVPIEFKSKFEQNIIDALQDIAGVSTSACNKFIPDMTKIIDRFNLPYLNGSNYIRVDFFSKTDKIIYQVEDTLKTIPKEKIIYIRYDIGVCNDLCGISISYFDHWQEYADGVKQPVFNVPLAIGLGRAEDQETSIYHLEEFILDLNKRFEIGKFTADQFASKQLLQDLEREGIPVEYLSVDRTDTAHIYFKSLCANGLINIAHNPLLIKETAELLRVETKVGSKIDHPKTWSITSADSAAGITTKGSKDISDAVVGSVYSCYLDLEHASELSNVAAAEKFMEDLENRIKKETKNPFQNVFGSIYG